MNPPNNGCGNHFPVFDKGPQSLGLKYEADAIVRRPGLAAGEQLQAQKAPGAGIHLQSIPMPVEHEDGIRLELRHEQLNGIARGRELRRIEACMTIERRVAERRAATYFAPGAELPAPRQDAGPSPDSAARGRFRGSSGGASIYRRRATSPADWRVGHAASDAAGRRSRHWGQSVTKSSQHESSLARSPGR